MPDLTTPLQSAAQLQIAAHQIIRNTVEAVTAPYSLSIVEWRMLNYIAGHEDAKATNLAKAFDVDKPVVTNIIKKFTQRDLVAIKNHPEDKRSKIIVCTATATAILDKVSAELFMRLAEMFAGVAAEDMEAYLRVLDHIVDTVG